MRKLILAIVLLYSSALFSQPGTLDTSFGTDGIELINLTNEFDNAQGVLALSDGKILVCGVIGSAADFDMVILRLNNDGTLDTSFGINGALVVPNAAGSDFAFDMTLLPTGNILVVGATSITPADTQYTAWVIKPDGTLDPSFAGDGIYESNIDGGEEYIYKTLVNNNLIYLVGVVYTPGFNYRAITVQCLDLQGNLVPAFGTNGTASYQPNSTDEFTVNGATFVTAGALAICGDKYNPASFGTSPMIMLMDLTGAPVTSFGTNGLWLDAGSGTYADIDFMNSQLVAVGNNNSAAFARRHNLDATIDATFGTNGTFTNAVGGYSAFYDCKLGADNLWYACGTTSSGFMVRDFLTTRFTTDGILDATWGSAGNVVTSLGNAFDDANALDMQSDGKVICAGLTAQTLNDMGVVRYLNAPVSNINESQEFGGSIFPNPAEHFLTLSTDQTGMGTLAIIDVSGKIVRKINMVFSHSQQIDIQELPAGIYSIQLIFENKQSVISFMKL